VLLQSLSAGQQRRRGGVAVDQVAQRSAELADRLPLVMATAAIGGMYLAVEFFIGGGHQPGSFRGDPAGLFHGEP
jgi:hypothetical protein